MNVPVSVLNTAEKIMYKVEIEVQYKVGDTVFIKLPSRKVSVGNKCQECSHVAVSQQMKPQEVVKCTVVSMHINYNEDPTWEPNPEIELDYKVSDDKGRSWHRPLSYLYATEEQAENGANFSGSEYVYE